MADSIRIKVIGLKELRAKLRRAPQRLKAVAEAAGKEAAEYILADRGGGKMFYPPETEHNRPPAPYYERGVGEHWPGGRVSRTSQQMHSRFTIKPSGLKTYIGNTARYAPGVIGDSQRPLMREIGWAKLIDAARAAKDKIARIYDRHVDAALRKLRLK